MSRARRRWIIAVIALLVSLIVVGSKLAPMIWREVQIRLVDRAIGDGRLEDAEERLDALIAAEPGKVQPRLLWVKVARRQGRITEAEEALQRAVELGLPIEQGRREYALLKAGSDFERVEKSLRQILEANPDDLEVRQALAAGSE